MKMEEKDFEPAGLIPRSIIRTVERFQQQLRPETVALGIQEFRISRYQVRVSVRYFFILLLLPLALNWAAKNLIIKPIVGYFWNSYQTSLFLNSYQAERAFQEMRDFESQLFFEMLLSAPENSGEESFVYGDRNILASENFQQNQNIKFKKLFSGWLNLPECPSSMTEPSYIQNLKLFPLETESWFEQVPLWSESTYNKSLITLSSEKSFLNSAENQKVPRTQDLGLKSPLLWVQPLKLSTIETVKGGEFFRERGEPEVSADLTQKLVLEERELEGSSVAENLLPKAYPLEYGPATLTLSMPKFRRESTLLPKPLQNTSFSNCGGALEELDIMPSGGGGQKPNDTTEVHSKTALNLKTISQGDYFAPRPQNTLEVVGLEGEPLGDWWQMLSPHQSVAHQIEPLESQSLGILREGLTTFQTKFQTLEGKSSLDSRPSTHLEYHSISHWCCPENTDPDGSYPKEVPVWGVLGPLAQSSGVPAAHAPESGSFLGSPDPKDNVPRTLPVGWTFRSTYRTANPLTSSSHLLPPTCPFGVHRAVGPSAFCPFGARPPAHGEDSTASSEGLAPLACCADRPLALTSVWGPRLRRASQKPIDDPLAPLADRPCSWAEGVGQRPKCSKGATGALGPLAHALASGFDHRRGVGAIGPQKALIDLGHRPSVGVVVGLWPNPYRGVCGLRPTVDGPSAQVQSRGLDFRRAEEKPNSKACAKSPQLLATLADKPKALSSGDPLGNNLEQGWPRSWAVAKHTKVPRPLEANYGDTGDLTNPIIFPGQILTVAHQDPLLSPTDHQNNLLGTSFSPKNKGSCLAVSIASQRGKGGHELSALAQEQHKALKTGPVPSGLSEETSLINLLGQEPQKTNLCLTVLFQKKTALLAELYNQQSITALSNMFGDCVMIVTIIFLVRWNAPQFTILKSFLIESFYSFNDAIKCFYIILITDFLVGFHSPRGWEIAMEMLLRHLGLPENEEFILLFVGTFPVFLDTAFKYWIFRYLNKISPSTVATYHSMIE